MKRKHSFIMAVAITIVLQSCSAVSDEIRSATQNSKIYNICLIIDGTDRLSNQSGVPYVSVSELEGLARSISTFGNGSLYVGYVDANCNNNKVAVFSHEQAKPIKPKEKKDYQTWNEYNQVVESYSKENKEYKDIIEASIDNFCSDCITLTKLAYSDNVAKQKKGSDVNGAINQAIRLLKSSCCDNERSYIVLVSDGCDNVGKQLMAIPPEMELLLVNSNVSMHQYGEIVSREFVTLNQVSNYIFK